MQNLNLIFVLIVQLRSLVKVLVNLLGEDDFQQNEKDLACLLEPKVVILRFNNLLHPKIDYKDAELFGEVISEKIGDALSCEPRETVIVCHEKAITYAICDASLEKQGFQHENLAKSKTDLGDVNPYFNLAFMGGH